MLMKVSQFKKSQLNEDDCVIYFNWRHEFIFTCIFSLTIPSSNEINVISPPSSCTVGRIRESKSSLIIITVSSSSSVISEPKSQIERKKPGFSFVDLSYSRQKSYISFIYHSFAYVIRLVSSRAQWEGHSRRSPWWQQRFLASKHSNQHPPFSILWWNHCRKILHVHRQRGILTLLNKIKPKLINSLTFRNTLITHSPSGLL